MALSFSGSPITREFGFLTEHAEARSDDDRVRSRRRCLQAHTPDEVEAALNLWLCGWSGPGSHLTPEPRTSGAVQTIALVPIPDRIRGALVGTQASLCLCAPILRHRPRVLDQSGTVLIALLPKTFEHHHSASPADLHRLSLDVGVCRHAVLKPTIVLPVARRANEQAITGLHLVDDAKKYRVAVFAVTGLFFARQAASLREKQSPRNVSHRSSASCVASDLSSRNGELFRSRRTTRQKRRRR
jgi:hypothetical protein